MIRPMLSRFLPAFFLLSGCLTDRAPVFVEPLEEEDASGVRDVLLKEEPTVIFNRKWSAIRGLSCMEREYIYHAPLTPTELKTVEAALNMTESR